MRRSHTYLLGVAFVTFAYLAAAPGAAQDPVEQLSPPPEVSADAKAEYDAWPPDRQRAYDAWPAATKDYYWSLNDERQDMFWGLSDEDKIALTAMTGPERDDAWATIESRFSDGEGPA